ncbi:putative hydrolase or acyltransferase of alpha/beta superfamily [Streptomyces noursei ATCC 11455]|uniref:alpha/beta fold hydrolase n=1 Tax=Streptomyces noursei TaxID=1971 RepID=UPI00081C6F5B|nr:putative hydrolase or acyltransferase of alpha/beta superfamily [Streptomyces noursei ATCC 11455]
MPYIDVPEARLWVEDSGGDGPPLVLLHALAGNGTCWAEQRPLFEAAGHRVVTYDMRGFGRTRSAPEHQAAGSMTADLEALVDALGLPRFSLVGTARGAVCATEYALDNPTRLAALVVSTSYCGLVDPASVRFRARYVDPDLPRLPTEEKELGRTYRAAHPEGVRRFLAMTRGSDSRDHGSYQSVREPLTLTRLARLPSVPVLVLAGDEDRYAPPPVMQRVADHLPNAEFHLMPYAGHSAYWEQPQEWNRRVRNFLRHHALVRPGHDGDEAMAER